MPVPKDQTMLKVNSRKFLTAMAKLEMEPSTLAEAAGIPKNNIYSMRRGFYTKPKYIGAAAKVLNVSVEDLLDNSVD